MNPALAQAETVAYGAQQLGWLVHTAVLHNAARLAGARIPAVSPATLRVLRRRYQALLAHDLANARANLYPRALLFQIPLGDYARALPELLRDGPRVVRRARRRDHRDLPRDLDRSRYPAYYLRNFHWQTDGYFSARSARLYDLGVEILFRGTADVMRRQVIPPITRFLGERGPGARLLDVACGTGRTLRQIAVAHPGLALAGVDLSPFYVAEARRVLGGAAELTVGNAEALPYPDASFDVVTSVYLFHELPRRARRNVMAELRRVLRPGGLLVLEDSAQLADSPEIAEALASFGERFHEPFFADYQRDDLAELVLAAGLELDGVEPHLVAKVVVARAP